MTFILFVLLFSLCADFSDAEILKSAGKINLIAARQETSTLSFTEKDAVVVNVEGDLRFYRGIEVELKAPQNLSAAYLMQFFVNAKETENQMLDAKPLYSESLGGRITNVYQIPFRTDSGLRRLPYITMIPEPLIESALPLVFSVSDTAGSTAGAVHFEASVHLIPGDEGAVRIILRYPQFLRDRPVTILIDDEVVKDTGAPQILREGEHQLLVLSEEYRTESRRFVVERGKTAEIAINLKDTTPALLFEAPERALIFVNNRRVSDAGAPYPLSPGTYDVKIQVSDYTIIKTIQVQKGKTYRIAFTVDMSVNEE